MGQKLILFFQKSKSAPAYDVWRPSPSTLPQGINSPLLPLGQPNGQLCLGKETIKRNCSFMYKMRGHKTAGPPQGITKIIQAESLSKRDFACSL